LKIKIKSCLSQVLIGIIINPFYITRINLYKNIKKHAHVFKGKLIDIGCGDKPYEDLLYNIKKFEGIEFETSVYTTTKAD
jgi:hypothetical protein